MYLRRQAASVVLKHITHCKAWAQNSSGFCVAVCNDKTLTYEDGYWREAKIYTQQPLPSMNKVGCKNDCTRPVLVIKIFVEEIHVEKKLITVFFSIYFRFSLCYKIWLGEHRHIWNFVLHPERSVWTDASDCYKRVRVTVFTIKANNATISRLEIKVKIAMKISSLFLLIWQKRH
jgi:hypothetical protein